MTDHSFDMGLLSSEDKGTTLDLSGLASRYICEKNKIIEGRRVSSQSSDLAEA